MKELFKNGFNPFANITSEDRKRYRENIIISQEERDRSSERMRINNPMKNKKTVEKMKATTKRKIENGELVYKKGCEHHAYKGNRRFNLECRKWLKGWIKQILIRDEYTCTMCKKVGGKLHVHHIKPLRDIIKNILDVENVDNIEQLKTENIIRYEYILKTVVESHELCDGTTLCKLCHGMVDDKYKRFKKNID